MDPPDMYQIRNGWTRKLVRVRIAPDTAVVPAGQSVKFTASGIFSDGRSRTINVSWAANGGTIDSTGLFTADSMPGTYQVFGHEPLAGLTDTATVIDTLIPTVPTTPTPTDQPPPPVDQPAPTISSVSVTPAKATLVVGESVQLKAVSLDSNGTVVTGLPVSWSSTNPAVASVSASGAVQTLSAGSTTIIAAVDGVDGKASVTVNEPAPTVSSVSVTPSSATLAIGESVQLSATAKDANGSTLAGFTVTWTTSAPAVASVSSSGLVRALASGNALITATINGVVGRASVTVPTPTGTIPADCSSYPYERLVSVSNSSELSAAVADAMPGDLIQLASGTYNGHWTLTRSGTATARIVLCGPRTAVLNGGSISSGSGVFLDGARYWVLRGFTITNSLGGIGGNRASYNQMISLDIHDVGQAGIHLRVFSKANLIRDNLIRNAGKHIAQYGEGVYIGTAESQWCTKTNCQPDESDSNRVIGNTISATTADGIQMMAGTTGGLIRRNKIDGSGMVAIDAAPPHWVLAMGNGIVVDSNTAVNALTHGIKVRRSSTASTWGIGNLFAANTLDVGSSGYAIYLETQPAGGTVVKCNNTALHAGSGLSNLSCTQ